MDTLVIYAGDSGSGIVIEDGGSGLGAKKITDGVFGDLFSDIMK